jgi:hypothetical protein
MTTPTVSAELPEALQYVGDLKKFFLHNEVSMQKLYVIGNELRRLHAQAQALSAAQAGVPADDGHEWRCFHCGEVFTDEESAALHFGSSEYQQAYCTIPVEHFRWMEAQHRRHLEDDSEASRTIQGILCEHENLRRRAEEIGYERGLRDAQRFPSELGLTTAPQPSPSPAPACKTCPGIPRPGCDYLAECGSVCNKCGQVHSSHLLECNLPTTSQRRWNTYEQAIGDPVFQVARSIMGTENAGQDGQLVKAINHVIDAQCDAPTAPAQPGQEGELTDYQILAITTAYEQGVGKGRQAHTSGKEIANPYSTGYRCDLAWQYGYEEGKEQAARIETDRAARAAPQPATADAVQAERIHLAWRGSLKACGVSEADRDAIGEVVLSMLAERAALAAQREVKP